MSSQPLKIGVALSSEEKGPRELVDIGSMALGLGFDHLAISDHFHPWIDEQGHSPFVWTVLGALSTLGADVHLGTAVTCPTTRIHPAIIAQAAATTAVMTGGQFFLGVGSGENLNEHILGDRWPPAPQRLSMLEESIHIIRELWTGEEVTFSGDHYRVEDARIYDVPTTPPPIMVSAFGPLAARTAAAAGDGLVLTGPDEETVAKYRAHGGTGKVIAYTKMCWAPTKAEARQTFHRLWPTSGVPGQLNQELRTPTLFEQAASVVDEDTAVGSTPVGPDPEPYVQSLRAFAEAGVGRVYLQQVGGYQEEAYRFLRDEVLPHLSSSEPTT